MKKEYRFHLYISTSPCGDGRLFSPHEVDATDEEEVRVGADDRLRLKRARGLLRTKVEAGEGTIPTAGNPGIQTCDGVLGGQRLLTMSCSDKIAKWNVVGLQGSLISHFLAEPVYLDGVILGSLYHAEHLARAVYGRLDGQHWQPTGNIADIEDHEEEPLPDGFRLNKPLLTGISNPEGRRPAKAPNVSVNWTTGDAGLEAVDATTGRDLREKSPPSRLCKRRLFERWAGLAGRLDASRKPAFGDAADIYLPLKLAAKCYSEVKEEAADYQRTKRQMIASFARRGLGRWIKKPLEQDWFDLIE